MKNIIIALLLITANAQAMQRTLIAVAAHKKMKNIHFMQNLNQKRFFSTKKNNEEKENRWLDYADYLKVRDQESREAKEKGTIEENVKKLLKKQNDRYPAFKLRHFPVIAEIAEIYKVTHVEEQGSHLFYTLQGKDEKCKLPPLEGRISIHEFFKNDDEKSCDEK